MKKFLTFVIFTSLILSFQNCAQSTLTPKEGPADSSSNKQSQDPSSLKISDVEKLAFNKNRPQQTVNSVGLELDIKTGVLTAVKANGDLNKGELYCLNDDELVEIQSILNSSQICVPEKSTQDPEQVCTMNYTEPYAVLLSEQSEIALGEARNGCEKPVDLCNNQKDQLQGFIAHVLSSLKKCSFDPI